MATSGLNIGSSTEGTKTQLVSPSTPPSEFAAAEAPAQVPGFHLIRPLGRGGMAVVYEAEQQLLGRKVALKLIRPGVDRDMQTMERFMREARAVAAVSHPRVLGVYEVGYAGGQMYMALELCPGGTLRDLLHRQGPLAEDHALGLLAEVCDGLAAIHRAGLIHRDIKPGNILLAGDGTVRVGDLGLAYRHGDEHMTATGCQVGTPAYMPPEQIRGDEGLDGRADLYAVGCTLFTLLTGQPPFRGNTDFVVTHRVLAGLIPDLAAQLKVRSGTVAVFRGLMAPDPRQRYADAAVVAAEFRRLVAGQKPLHLPASVAVLAESRPRPRSLLIGALVAAVLATVTCAWLLFAPATQARMPPAPPPLPAPEEVRRLPAVPRSGAQQEAMVCRARLARLDDPAPLRQRQLEGLNRDLANLTASTPGDPGLGRWRERLGAEAGRFTILQEHLAGLDRALPGEAESEGLAADLADYLRRVDADDAAGARWTAVLRQAARVSAQRQGERQAILDRCSILDRPENPGAAALDALAKELDHLAALGDGEDLQRLKRRLAACRAEIVEPATPAATATAPAVPASVTVSPAVVEPADPPPAWAAASGKDAAGRWAELRCGNASSRFRLIGAGTFAMGAGPGADERGHQVTLSRAFWLAETECTQGFWRAVTGVAAPGSPRGGQQPVTDVTWDETAVFLTTLRRVAPQCSARLPSEAEWEWAVLGGHGLPSWTRDNAGGSPHPVAQAPADALGCYDLLGNVWEWCADAYLPYPASVVTDPLPLQGERRVIRGGGYASQAATAVLRTSLGSGHRQPFVGFRLAIDAR